MSDVQTHNRDYFNGKSLYSNKFYRNQFYAVCTVSAAQPAPVLLALTVSIYFYSNNKNVIIISIFQACIQDKSSS